MRPSTLTEMNVILLMMSWRPLPLRRRKELERLLLLLLWDYWPAQH